MNVSWKPWALLALLCGAGHPQEARREPLVMRVSADGWGDAGVGDLTKVLQSAGESLAVLFPERKFPVLEVSRSTSSPITLFQRGPAGEIRVKLDAEGRHWAQFSFQFGHEMGHIVCGFADYPNPNLWFEETLCEAASLFVLGRLAESWKTRPPYPNWKDYAEALKKYRDERIAKEKLPDGTSLADWFRGREPSLRKEPTQRSLNLKMAAALLPLFEEAPERWGAVATLNAVQGDASRTFPQHLRDWSRSSPEKHREFIAKIAGRFGVSIDR
jgi:hypothetical protein